MRKLICGLLIALTIYVIIENNSFSVRKETIEFDNLPEEFSGYRVLHLSDGHGKAYGKGNQRLIDAIEKTRPDIIVMTGDMVSSRDHEGRVFLELLEGLSGYPSFYITGNHEQYLSSRKLNDLKDKLRDLGVVVLENNRVEVERHGEFIDLYGLVYPNHFYRSGNYLDSRDIDEFLGEKGDRWTLLLSHNPFHFEGYVDWGADLTLAGHVHGGMIRLPIIGGLLSPEHRLFPKYSRGIYEKHGKKMLVSTGIGIGEIGFRVFNRPEMVLIELKRGD